jgi:NAD kinase
MMNALIVAKYSKLEWEMKCSGQSQDQILAKYSKERANVGAILKSHEKQLAVRNLFTSAFQCSIVMLEDMPKVAVNLYDLIIVLGGDNSFTYASHFVHSTPILGINSDPDRSSGCLTRYAIKTEQDVYDLVEALDFNNFRIESWARLEATLDGQKITPATSEYFLGERLRKYMSRHVLVYRGQEVEQKCSGFIIATGAGSTGWYRSTMPDPGETEWRPETKRAAFIATEQYQPMGRWDKSSNKWIDVGVNPNLKWGNIEEGEEIKIYSLNDNDGHISIDSWEERPFNRGSEARIYLGEPLQVLVPNELG